MLSSSRMAEERQKLLQFYNKHAPHKVQDVETSLTKYAAKGEKGIEKMWKILRKNYLGEGSSVASDTESAAYGSDMRSVETPENPVKIGSNVSFSFRGHSPKPPLATRRVSIAVSDEDRSEVHGRLLRYFLHRAPENVDEVEALLDKYSAPGSGGFNVMWAELEARYGSAPPEPTTNSNGSFALPRTMSGLSDRSNEPKPKYSEQETRLWKDRLKKFYNFYCPGEKTDKDLDGILSHYSPPKGYELMWEQLLKKYGAEPIDPATGFIKRFLLAEEEEEAQLNRLNELKSFKFGDAASTTSEVSPALGHKLAEEDFPDVGELSPMTPQASPRSALKHSPPTSSASPQRQKSIGQRERASRQEEGVGPTFAALVQLHALLRLQGCDWILIDRAREEQKMHFFSAVEREVASNLGIRSSQVKVTNVSPNTVLELTIDLSNQQIQDGVGEALVTRVLLGKFTVPSIRESYRVDLGGNPIQLHAEGAALFGGSCTPNFSGVSSGKGVTVSTGADGGQNNFSSFLEGDSTSVARVGSPNPTHPFEETPIDSNRGPVGISQWPPRNTSSNIVAREVGQSAKNASSPPLAPPQFAGERRERDTQRLVSPFRLWSAGTEPPHVNADSTEGPRNSVSPQGGQPSATSQSWSLSVSRRPAPRHTQSDPSKLLSSTLGSPSSNARLGLSIGRAPQALEVTEKKLFGKPSGASGLSTTTSFLADLWEENTGTVAEAPPLVDEREVPPQTFNEALFRETIKPHALNKTPSTDNVPQFTRTAPPSFTQFPVTAGEELHTSTQSAMKYDNVAAARAHATELLAAIKEPQKYWKGGAKAMIAPNAVMNTDIQNHVDSTMPQPMGRLPPSGLLDQDVWSTTQRSFQDLPPHKLRQIAGRYSPPTSAVKDGVPMVMESCEVSSMLQEHNDRIPPQRSFVQTPSAVSKYLLSPSAGAFRPPQQPQQALRPVAAAAAAPLYSTTIPKFPTAAEVSTRQVPAQPPRMEADYYPQPSYRDGGGGGATFEYHQQQQSAAPVPMQRGEATEKPAQPHFLFDIVSALDM